MMIREAVVQYLTRQPQRKLSTDLWVSDLGMHPYKAMARVLNGEQSEFDIVTREKMQQGNVLEADTVQAVTAVLGQAMPQFPLWNDTWSGYADLVLGHSTDQVTIVEHKAQGDKWFDYKESLPKSTHVCQLWLYGQLYEERYGIKPTLCLYYRAWGQYAEFEVRCTHYVTAFGTVNGHEWGKRELYISPPLLRKELEDFYQTRTLPQATKSEIDSWDYPEASYVNLARETP